LTLAAIRPTTVIPIGGSSVGTDYIWFAGQPVAQAFTDPSQPARYTFTDHLGTPILQTDATAALVWRVEYEPYGSIYTYRAGDANDPQALRLPGQEAPESLNTAGYNIFRWYRAEWGRYTQTDPIDLEGGVNLFAYAAQDPLRFADPTGLDTVGCDSIPGMAENGCTLDCCAAHDKCYDDNHCTAGSWGDKPKCGCDEAAGCKKCNSDVKKCFTKCEFSITWRPNNNKRFYCAARHQFVRIPGDYPNRAAAEKACEEDHSKDCKIPLTPKTNPPGRQRF
jgi:RHS repeat-associated protein